jgi:hypothetical protein
MENKNGINPTGFILEELFLLGMAILMISLF